jgi:hypothetical protein
MDKGRNSGDRAICPYVRSFGDTVVAWLMLSDYPALDNLIPEGLERPVAKHIDPPRHETHGQPVRTRIDKIRRHLFGGFGDARLYYRIDDADRQASSTTAAATNQCMNCAPAEYLSGRGGNSKTMPSRRPPSLTDPFA